MNTTEFQQWGSGRQGLVTNPYLRTMTKQEAATKAGKWLKKLERLEGNEFSHMWNKLISESVAVEVEDLRMCGVVTLGDESVLVYSQESANECVREVMLPRFAACVRTVIGWRLAGTKALKTQEPSFPHEPWLITTKSAAKRLGISMAELRHLGRSGELTPHSQRANSPSEFCENELDYYRKRHPKS